MASIGNTTVTLNPYLGTCKDCKHWYVSEEWQEYGYTVIDGISEGWAECTLVGSEGGEPKNRESIALAIDDAYRSGALLTSPDFGCIQFEKKDA